MNMNTSGRRSDAAAWRRSQHEDWTPQDSKAISASHRVTSFHDHIQPKSRYIKVDQIKIQVISDTHLEFAEHDPTVKLSVLGNIICLCGDIGYPGQRTYQNFIRWCSQNYQLVFLITGNHEYYDKKNTKQAVDSKLSNFIATFPNVYLLSEGSVVVESQTKKYKFVGATLWSPVKSSQQSIKITKNVNDYRKITVDGIHVKYNKLTPDHVEAWHNEDIQYLTKEIFTAVDGEIIPTVVLTHHLPSKKFLTIESDLNDAYASDTDFLIKSPVVMWCYGHTHRARREFIGDVLIVSNPLGHISDDTNFDGKQVFDFNHGPLTKSA